MTTTPLKLAIRGTHVAYGEVRRLGRASPTEHRPFGGLAIHRESLSLLSDRACLVLRVLSLNGE